jgi:hypothetical protein
MSAEGQNDVGTEDPFETFERLSADSIIELFNTALDTDFFSSLSEEDCTEGVALLYGRILREPEAEEREKLFCILSKVVQITRMEHLLDTLYE